MNNINVHNSTQFFYLLKRLGTTATVLHMGAHPDDEDIGLLVYVSHKLGGRAVYWSATRGEGGQNIINSHRGRELGVFRTWESLACREMDGGECLFGPFVDYGFSKNEENAFSKWGRQDLLREVVRAIRLVRPQIVISRWTGNPRDGHGHHRAVGQAVTEAFDMAGDPEEFPELLESGLMPWQPLKLYQCATGLKHLMNAWQKGISIGRPEPDLEKDGILKINTGEFDPIDNRTYQERAWLAMNCHKTQGMGFSPEPGDFYYYLVLKKALVTVPLRETELFDGIDTSLRGLFDSTDHINPEVRNRLTIAQDMAVDALKLYRVEKPLSCSDPLKKGLINLRAIGALPHGPEDTSTETGTQKYPREKTYEYKLDAIKHIIDQKIMEFEKAIAYSMGLRLECLATRRKLTPGESTWVSLRLWNPNNVSLDRTTFQLNAPGDWEIVPMEDMALSHEGHKTLKRYEVFAGQDARLSCPYWLEKPGGPYAYNCLDAQEIQQPLGEPFIVAKCRVFMEDTWITLHEPVVHRKGFPGGYSELPITLIPPVSLHPESDKKILLTEKNAKKLGLQIVARCNDDERPAEGYLELDIPQGWTVSPPNKRIRLEQGGGARSIAFSVTVPPNCPEGSYSLDYKVRCRSREYSVVLTPVRMNSPGLPANGNESSCIKEEYILSPSRLEVHVIDALYQKDRRYGYITGAKEDLLPTLKSVGINFKVLSDHDIIHRDLNIFDIIVIGPNAYIIREGLRENSFRLMEYMSNGGTLIVQYQGYGYEKQGLAPYPFRYRRPHDRVTDEKAEVRVLRPDAPLFRYPNLIRQDDFDGWVHDRGLYFFGDRDDKYVSYLACSDTGEDPKSGGLIGCPFGQGNYLYTGYSLFRQLPAGNPGAFRLFFNILAFGCKEYNK